jgi:long-chain fatty acid transport protein
MGGLTLFRPERQATITGTAGGFSDGEYSGNGRDIFLIPEAGYNKQITPEISLGVSIYGNGGMNTSYGPIPLFNSSHPGSTGIDYIQLFVAPTLAWKVTPTQTVGVAVNLGYQRFSAKGLDNFKAYSLAPNDLTGNGHDDAFGIGLHFGWIGQINDQLSLGATYQTKTYFQTFDKYKGLFAGEGNMDTPAWYGVGASFKATADLTLATDIERIQFSDVHSIGNTLSQLTNTSPIGASNGPRFGWKDSTVYKLGLSYHLNEQWTLRAGYNHVTQPIRNSEALFNILAPAVVEDHATLGGTYNIDEKSAVSFNYVHAFNHVVNGANAVPAGFGGGNVSLKMYQDSLGVAYAYKF